MGFENRVCYEEEKDGGTNDGEDNGSSHVTTIGIEDIANSHPLHVRVPFLSQHSHCRCCPIGREQQCCDYKVCHCYRQHPRSVPTASCHRWYHQWCRCVWTSYRVWHQEKPSICSRKKKKKLVTFQSTEDWNTKKVFFFLKYKS